MMRYSLLAIIMVAVLVWACLHAWGAYLAGHNLGRSLMIGGFGAGFLAFWGVLLWVKRDRWAAKQTKP